MNRSFCSLIIPFLVGLVCSINGQNVEEKFYEQKLDHVNGLAGTWQQKYLESREYFKENGPIFIRLGGVLLPSVNPSNLQNGSIVDYAKEQGAAMIALEARYFGTNAPTSDLSQENLDKYFSIQQTLADVQTFVTWIRAKPEFMKSKVVGFGSGFFGSRVLELKNKNPETFDIVVLSGAIAESRYEFPEFLRDVVEAMNDTNADCYEVFHSGMECLGNILQGGSCQGHSYGDLKPLFGLCDDLNLTNPYDVTGFLRELSRYHSILVLANDPTPTTPYNIEKMCMTYTSKSSELTPVERIAEHAKMMTTFVRRPCIEFRFDEINKFYGSTAPTSLAVITGERQRIYRRCHEGVFLQTLDNFDLSFKDTLVLSNYILEICNRQFGVTEEQVRANTKAVEASYGRKVPKDCAIFVTGSYDVYKYVEIMSQEEAGSCNRFVGIEGASFGRDTGPIPAEGMSYPKGLRPAQMEIGSVLGKWLQTGNCCM